MVSEANEKGTMDFMLLRENIWKVEDRLNIALESIFDHEAQLMRLRRTADLLSQRLTTLESRLKESNNGQR